MTSLRRQRVVAEPCNAGKTHGLGRASPAQMAAHDEMRAAGAEVAVVVVEAAVAHLELWGLLWGRAQ
jgi:hypothetical protein